MNELRKIMLAVIAAASAAFALNADDFFYIRGQEGTYYSTFADARTAASAGSTIVLAKDYVTTNSGNIVFQDKKNLTLDLGGHTVTADSVAAISVSETATITNGTIDCGTGAKRSAVGGRTASIAIYDATLNVQATTITSGRNGAPVFDGCGSATVNIQTGADITGAADVFRSKYLSSDPRPTVNISGGRVSSTGYGYIVYLHCPHTVANVTVSGGEIVATKAFVYVYYDSQSSPSNTDTVVNLTYEGGTVDAPKNFLVHERATGSTANVTPMTAANCATKFKATDNLNIASGSQALKIGDWYQIVEEGYVPSPEEDDGETEGGDGAGGAEESVTWTYSSDTKTLTADVAEGKTGSWSADDADETYRAYLTENTVTNFIKTGAGEFFSDADLEAYVGNVIVSAGTYTYTNSVGVGNYWYQKTASKRGCVRVLNGATLKAFRCKDAKQNDWGSGYSGYVWRYFYFEGTGVDGKGALVFTNEVGVTTTRIHFSNNLILTGDATIYNASPDTSLRQTGKNTSDYPFSLSMNGHTLTLDGENAGWLWSNFKVNNPGSLIARRQCLTIQNTCLFNGTAENVLSFEDGARFSVNNANASGGWTLDARALSQLTVVSGYDSSKGVISLTQSRWGGDLLTGPTRLPVFYSDDVCNFTVGGVVSGAGLDVGTQYRGGYYFHLLNSTNSFTNGLSVVGQSSAASKLGNLFLHANGALPADGDPLALTNATVTIKTDLPCQLPSLAADQVTAVNDGFGAWSNSVVKTGAGNLTWNSLLSAETLDVREGSVIVKDKSGDFMKQLAGFVEGDLTMTNGTTKATAQYGTKLTNHVELSMSAMYDANHTHWTTPLPAEVSAKSDPRRVYNYWGYIWNREATNVTVSLAVYSGTHGHLTVGAFTQGNANTKAQTGAHFYNGGFPVFATVELAPGATPIQYSGYCVSTALKDAYTKNGFDWQANFGAAWKYGAATSNSADYAKLEDPGDGSLFTWTLPEQVVENETKWKCAESETVIRRAPYFGTMKFAAGTGVTFERGWYSVPTLEGLPTVGGITNALTVTTKFSFSAREAVDGGKLTTTGSFALGAGAQIEIVDPNDATRHYRKGVRRFTVVETANGVVLPDDVTVTGATDRWSIERSDDGKKLVLVYRPNGMVFILR